MLLDATLWAADATRDAAIAEGARLLAAGELLGLPTETVYGLAARAVAIPRCPVKGKRVFCRKDTVL